MTKSNDISHQKIAQFTAACCLQGKIKTTSIFFNYYWGMWTSFIFFRKLKKNLCILSWVFAILIWFSQLLLVKMFAKTTNARHVAFNFLSVGYRILSVSFGEFRILDLLLFWSINITIINNYLLKKIFQIFQKLISLGRNGTNEQDTADRADREKLARSLANHSARITGYRTEKK